MVAHYSHTLERLHTRDGGRCWLCFADCSLEDATRDHVIPDSMGGAYAWANFALAHKDCNHDRADRFPAARYQRFGMRAQQRAWNRSGGACERCGIRTGLVLDQPPWANDVAIKCTDCRWGSTAYRGLMPPAPKRPLSVVAAEVLPEEAWAALLAACAEEPLAVPAVPAELQAALVEVADVQDDPVQAAPAIPAPRPRPRYTPLDHAKQVAQSRARADEVETVRAAQAAHRVQLFAVAARALTPWYARLGRRVASWWPLSR